jgi:GTP-binding protein
VHFVDEAAIHVKGGDGGSGCVSFRREKFVPRGGPDGGDGGDGGSVVIIADPNLGTLTDLVSRTEFHAGNGGQGRGKNRHGANGQDLIIRVPLGTILTDREEGVVLADLAEPRRAVVVAVGGKGGRGNAQFATPTNQAPRKFEEGTPGQERHLRLELKLVADVGLIGRPNAGKSTLISRISAAHPKIADYPFTTLQPVIGIVDADPDRRFAVADLPGLIEGAHEGRGLGDEFLRHVERTRLLVHVVDALPIDGTDPLENYRTIRNELALYSAELAAKPEIVVANKVDLHGAEAGARRLREGLDCPVVEVSAMTGRGLRRLVGMMLEKLEEIRRQADS